MNSGEEECKKKKFIEKKSTQGKAHRGTQRERNMSLVEFKSFIRWQSSRSLSSLRPIILFVPSQVDLSQDPPWGSQAHIGQDRSQSEGFWEEQDSLWPRIIPWLLTPRSLSGHVSSVSLVPQNRGGQRSLNPSLKQGFALLGPCHIITLTIALTVVTSILEGKQEADCKSLCWSPPISHLREGKEETSFK